MNRYLRTITVTIILAVALSLCPIAHAIDVPLNTTAHVYFSPHGGATDAVVQGDQRGEERGTCQAYSFTPKPIAEALIKAKKAGSILRSSWTNLTGQPDTVLVTSWHTWNGIKKVI